MWDLSLCQSAAKYSLQMQSKNKASKHDGQSCSQRRDLEVQETFQVSLTGEIFCKHGNQGRFEVTRPAYCKHNKEPENIP